MLCPFCEGPLPAGARYCPTCGTMVSDTAGIGSDDASAKSAPLPRACPATSYVDPYPPTTSVSAVISLLFGISAWCLLPLIGAFLAVITGHQAQQEIRASGNRLSGTGLAAVGLFLGYLQLIPLALLAILGLAAVLVMLATQVATM